MPALNYRWFAAVEASPVAEARPAKLSPQEPCATTPNTGKKAAWGEDRDSDGPLNNANTLVEELKLII